ncbi:MAG: hypothetical protein HeimC3_09410 [Candidatus Heimdallarchaeota archaeon LC_3]|nr:MAG: hypothetical protein HeimC3_09410 [Candidatus Heimdallarchaeota archaeon LC_3]
MEYLDINNQEMKYMNLDDFFWTILTITFFSFLGIILFPFIITTIALGAIFYCILIIGFKMHDLMHLLHFCPHCGIYPIFLKFRSASHFDNKFLNN